MVVSSGEEIEAHRLASEVLGERILAVAAAALLVSTGCTREPAVPDGVVMGLQPVDGSTCIAVDATTKRAWWWEIGGADCQVTASSVVEAPAQAEGGSLRVPSLGISFTINLIPHRTREVNAKLAELEGSIVFITADQTVIPTLVTDRLTLHESPESS